MSETSEAKHTALPWHHHDMEDATVCASDGTAIVYTKGNAVMLDTAEANAAYIVRACNNYRRLLEAAKNLEAHMASFDSDQEPDRCGPECPERIELRAAIEEVEK